MSQETSIPQLIDVSKDAVTVARALPVNELLALFQGDPELLTVAISHDGAFLGSVSRKDLLNLLSRKFAMDLYAKKPVTALLDDLGGKKIVLSRDLDINEAAVLLLSLDPTLQTDAFPIVSGAECVGVVAVSDLMMAVAEQQRGLLEALDRLSSRIREEVAHGVKIQQDLLPLPLYRFQGVTVGAGIATCSEIGGDFFDYFSVGENILGLVIADVSGHGVQAGMVTTAAKASLHTLISLGVTTPSGLLAAMNNAILTTARQSLLMTCLIASIDLSAGTLTIANAGHNFPYLLRKGGGEPEMLDATAGFPLGFERDSEFPEICTNFAPGDALFMYTDGLVECADAGGEELGYRRLEEMLAGGRDLLPQLLHGSLLEGAAAFTGTGSFDDDVTTLVARFDGLEPQANYLRESVRQMHTVAVLYRDENDQRLWESTLDEIPGLLNITVAKNLTVSLERLRRIGSSLRLVILSSRLYPGEHPELAARIRAACPGSEILVISPSEEPSPPLKPLLVDRVRHLAFNSPQDDRRDREYFPAIVSRLIERRPWEIDACLKEGTALHSFQLRSSDDKEELIGALEAVLKGDGEEFEMLRQKGSLLLDELLENALYDAPRGPDGRKLFRKGEKRGMLPQERIVFSFGFDGETLALQLTDSWGSLEPEVVLEHLARNQEGDLIADDTGGRGLFIIWRFLDHFHLNVQPGLETVVGGHLQLSSGLPLEAPRGFHITELDQGDAA